MCARVSLCMIDLPINLAFVPNDFNREEKRKENTNDFSRWLTSWSNAVASESMSSREESFPRDDGTEWLFAILFSGWLLGRWRVCDNVVGNEGLGLAGWGSDPALVLLGIEASPSVASGDGTSAGLAGEVTFASGGVGTGGLWTGKCSCEPLAEYMETGRLAAGGGGGVLGGVTGGLKRFFPPALELRCTARRSNGGGVGSSSGGVCGTVVSADTVERIVPEVLVGVAACCCWRSFSMSSDIARGLATERSWGRVTGGLSCIMGLGIGGRRLLLRRPMARRSSDVITIGIDERLALDP